MPVDAFLFDGDACGSGEIAPSMGIDGMWKVFTGEREVWSRF